MGRVATGRPSGVKHSQIFFNAHCKICLHDGSIEAWENNVTSDWTPKVTGGHATWMQRRGGKQWRRRKERNKERKKAKKVKLRFGTLNVGTMTGKGKEVADVMERRRVDILCVQETRWKGERARCIGGGYKMWYCGSGNKKNGVGIISKKEQVDRVVEIWRVTDRIICLKMELDGVMLNVISAYAP